MSAPHLGTSLQRNRYSLGRGRFYDSFLVTDVRLLTWNVTQYVYVTATAATSQRPACAGGRRYCAALRSRSEMLRHSVSSRDPFYHGLKVAKVNVSISTVHDAMPAPILTSARFTDALNGLTLTFDSTTNFGGQAGEFDCSLVLNTSFR